MLTDYIFPTETAMQNVAMFLRSVPNWEIVEPLPDVGEFFSFLKNCKK